MSTKQLENVAIANALQLEAARAIPCMQIIIVLTPSITETQKLLHMCERELQWLDTAINHTKSNCLRVGPRFDAKCTQIVGLSGHCIVLVVRNALSSC